MKVIIKSLVGIVVIVVFAILIAIPTMLLWNWLMPVLFGLIKIGFWQALGLNLLTGILFKNTNNYKNE